jgi:hypothetical protein
VLQSCCNRSRTEPNTTGFAPDLKDRKPLRQADFLTGQSVAGEPQPNLQGGGRWFESSIAHYKNTGICRRNVDYEKGPNPRPTLFDTTLTPPRATRVLRPSRRRPRPHAGEHVAVGIEGDGDGGVS